MLERAVKEKFIFQSSKDLTFFGVKTSCIYINILVKLTENSYKNQWKVVSCSGLIFSEVKNQVDIYGQVNGSHANHGERL